MKRLVLVAAPVLLLAIVAWLLATAPADEPSNSDPRAEPRSQETAADEDAEPPQAASRPAAPVPRERSPQNRERVDPPQVAVLPDGEGEVEQEAPLQPAPEPILPGRLEVVVLRPNGSVADGARVIIRRREQTPRNRAAQTSEFHADAQGRVLVEELEPGGVIVDASLGEFAGVTARLDIKSEAVATVQIDLVPAWVVVVETVDEHGAPVAGAIVNFQWDDSQFRRLAAPLTPTGADGRVRFEPIARASSETGFVIVKAKGYSTELVSLDSREPADPVTRVVLRSGFRVLVRCIDEAGKPVSGVSVDSRQARGHSNLGITDDDGRLDSPSAPRDHPFIVLWPPDHAPVGFPATVDGDVLDLGEVRLTPERTLAGTVEVPSLLEGAYVVVDLVWGDDAIWLDRETVRDGRFSFTKTGAQQYYLARSVRFEAGTPWASAALPWFEVPLGAEKVALKVPDAVDLRLRFRTADKEQPIQVRRVWLWVIRPDGTYALEVAIDAAEASDVARVAMFESGRFDIWVEVEGYRPRRVNGLTFETGHRLEVDLAMTPE